MKSKQWVDRIPENRKMKGIPPRKKTRKKKDDNNKAGDSNSCWHKFV